MFAIADESDNASDPAPLVMNRCDHPHSKSQNKVLEYVGGVASSLMSAAMFGSMYVPMKKFDTGNCTSPLNPSCYKLVA